MCMQASWPTIVSRVIIACSILTVATYQIIQGVDAIRNVSFSSSFSSVSRSFPGVLICPMMINLWPGSQRQAYPTWSSQGYVSLSTRNDPAFSSAFPKWQNQQAMANQPAYVVNTDADFSRARCANAITDCSQLSGAEKSQCQVTSSTYGLIRPGALFGITAKPVFISNSASACIGQSCLSLFPPRVGCLALDHTMFPASVPNYVNYTSAYAPQVLSTNLVPAVSSCNPMLEGDKPNSASALKVLMNFWAMRFSYSGLQQVPLSQPCSPSVTSNCFNSSYDGPWGGLPLDLQPTFPGLTALFYNPVDGVPSSLKFDLDLAYANSFVNGLPSVPISTWQAPPNQSYSPTSMNDSPTSSAMQLQAPVTADVDFTMSRKFASTSEKIFNGNNPSIIESNYSISVAPTPLLQFPSQVLNPLCGCSGISESQMTLRFAASSTLIVSQTISTTLLTTLSLLISTAATLYSGTGSLAALIDSAYLRIKKCRCFRRFD